MSGTPELSVTASQGKMMLPLTRSAASILAQSNRIMFGKSPVDEILGGGLRQGYIVELSGPPGSPKERLAIDITKTVVKDGGNVLFVDMQNMVMPAILSRALEDEDSDDVSYEKQVRYLNIYTLPDLMIFMHNLPTYLDEEPKPSLLVLNSLSFPFQSASDLSSSTRQHILERIKPVLARNCAARNLSVVITTQLATKLIKQDGTSGNFDNGARGIMMPSLGNAYLPPGRTYRLLIAPQSRTSGVLRLLASPTYAPRKDRPPEVAYELEGGIMRAPAVV